MEFKVKDIAHLVGGTVEGNPEGRISSFAKIQEGKEGCISFLSNEKYEKYIYETASTAVLVANSFTPKEPISTSLIRVDDPYTAFSILLAQYQQLSTHAKKGVEPMSFVDQEVQVDPNTYVAAFAYVSKGVKLGKNVKIYPHVFIGDNVQIGDNTIIFSGVKIYSHSVIGSNCVIHAGVVIGSDGFGFAPQADGSYKSIPQIGNVIIGNDVVIGANTTVDCATMGSTIIEDGVKLDNLIQIGHNVKIGANTVIAAQTGISGSTEIGKQSIIGGQVGIAGHLKLAEKTSIAAQSGVGKNTDKPGMALFGSPAFDLNDYMRSYVVFRQLPKLKKQIDTLLQNFHSKEQ